MTSKLEKAQWRPFLDTVIEAPGGQGGGNRGRLPQVGRSGAGEMAAAHRPSHTIPTTTLWKSRSMASTT